MLKALREIMEQRGYRSNAKINWYYPSIGEYALELEKENFRVIHAEHFDRQTQLKGNQGMRDWFIMFGDRFFVGIPEEEKEKILKETQEKLRSTHFIDGVWNADYKRIRVIAIKE